MQEGERGGEEMQVIGMRVNPNGVTHSFSIFLLLAVSWASFPSRLRIFRESLLCVSFAPCMSMGEGKDSNMNPSQEH